MKRLFSFFLLFLVLLNAVGYYGLLLIAQEHWGITATRRIEQNAGELSGQVIFRVPFSVPYATNTAYTQANGRLTYEGKVYRLVKQKLYNDTLYIVCIHDNKGTQLEGMLSACTRSFSNESKEHPSESKVALPACKYYLLGASPLLHDSPGQIQDHNCFEVFVTYCYTGVQKIFQPPQHHS